MAALGAALCVALSAAPAARRAQGGAIKAFVGARILASPERPIVDRGVIVVQGGRVVSITADAAVPDGATTVDVAGKFIIPGLISAHAHISDVDGLKPRAYTAENTERQLRLFAAYGVTTVWSLGGEQAPAFAARAAQDAPTLNRARVFLAGDVITGDTPAAARQMVARVAAGRPDIIKIRVDDNLGTTKKMTPDVYQAVIDEAHARGLKVAAHIFYLADAKGLLRAGVDMIAHSVRDTDIDAEFVALMKARDVAYCPTLTREVSVFAYESTPSFFSDPFFLRGTDPAVIARLNEPARQEAMRQSKSAQAYKAGLVVAERNLKAAAEAGLRIVMGTDSGVSPERFEGYFEHREMEMMGEAGMRPGEVLRAATIDAARAMGRGTGTIAVGDWADFVVLDRDPLKDIANTRSISSVWIAGNQVDR